MYKWTRAVQTRVVQWLIVYPRELKANSQRDTYTSTFAATLFTKAQR